MNEQSVALSRQSVERLADCAGGASSEKYAGLRESLLADLARAEQPASCGEPESCGNWCRHWSAGDVCLARAEQPAPAEVAGGAEAGNATPVPKNSCETCLNVYLPHYLFTCRTCGRNPARYSALAGDHYTPKNPASPPAVPPGSAGVNPFDALPSGGQTISNAAPAEPAAVPEGECPHRDKTYDRCKLSEGNGLVGCDCNRDNETQEYCILRALAADRAKLEQECAERGADRLGLVKEIERLRKDCADYAYNLQQFRATSDSLAADNTALRKRAKYEGSMLEGEELT